MRHRALCGVAFVICIPLVTRHRSPLHPEISSLLLHLLEALVDPGPETLQHIVLQLITRLRGRA